MTLASMLLRRVLWSSPPFVRNAVATLYGAWHRRRATGGDYRDQYAFLERTQRMAEEDLRGWQERRVLDFLRRSARDVPYYRRLFADQRLDPDRIAGLDDLRRLPLLEKETLRERAEELLADRFRRSRRGVVRARTSGTTGKGLEVVLSLSAWRREYAFRDLHHSWAGIRPGDRAAWIAGHPVAPPDRLRPPFWVEDRWNRAVYFSSQHLAPATLPSYLERLARLRPTLVRGYPSSLHSLALAANEKGAPIPRPRAVFTNSETLLGPQREVIESAFGCKVYDWYGNTECAGNVVECERGALHVKLEHSLIELLRPDGSPARPGETAEMVCTGFGNEAMPLIRYRIGDLAVPSDRRCACGRPGPLVERIDGRIEDVLVTSDGRRLGRLDHLLKFTTRVREAQIVQDAPGRLTLRIVAGAGFGPADIAAIENEARARLGDGMAIRFELVQALERGPSGKLRFAVSRLAAGPERSAGRPRG